MKEFPSHPMQADNSGLHNLYLAESIADLNEALEAEIKNKSQVSRVFDYISRHSKLKKVYLPNITRYMAERITHSGIRIVTLFDEKDELPHVFVPQGNWDSLSNPLNLPTDVVIDVVSSHEKPQFLLRNVLGKTLSPDFRTVGLQIALS